MLEVVWPELVWSLIPLVGPLWIFMEPVEVTSGVVDAVAVEVVVAAAKLAWLVVVAVVFLVVVAGVILVVVVFAGADVFVVGGTHLNVIW